MGHKTRTFLISNAVLKKLDIIHDCYHLDRATFIRMAIYHGIEQISNGYYPYRNHNLKKMKRQKYNISLPEETWKIFKKAKESLKYKLDEHIPDGEMIEMFIRIEIKGYVAFVNKYTKDDTIDDSELFDETETVKITATIPNILYRKFEEEIESTGLCKGKVGRYLITNALLRECFASNYEMIDTDADLIRFIVACGLDIHRTITLLKYLMEANKIIFLNDNNVDY